MQDRVAGGTSNAPFLNRERIPLFWVLIYLAAPSLIFLGSWVTPAIGLPASLAVVAAIASFRPDDRRPPVAELLFAATVSAAALFLAGFTAGRYCWDWVKHWALLNVVSTTAWPSEVTLGDEQLFLRYYAAAYLLPGLLHKAFEGLTIKAAAAAGLGTGYAAMAWAMLRSSTHEDSIRRMAITAVALTLSGADFWGDLIARAIDSLPLAGLTGFHREWWFLPASGLHLQYSSMVTAVTWAPHQSLATIITTIFWLTATTQERLRAAILAHGLLALWSPYGLLGLLPIAFVRCWPLRRCLTSLRTQLVGLSALTCAAIIAAYLMADSPPAGIDLRGFAGRLSSFPDYLPFIVIELTPFLVLIRRRLSNDPATFAALLALIVIPFLEGGFGDFTMRASLGALTVLSVRAADCLIDDLRARRFRFAVLSLILCMPTVISEVTYHVERGAAHRNMPATDPLGRKWMHTFADNEQVSLAEYVAMAGDKYVAQYFSRHRPAVLRRPDP